MLKIGNRALPKVYREGRERERDRERREGVVKG